jgi:hypothetical protein
MNFAGRFAQNGEQILLFEAVNFSTWFNAVFAVAARYFDLHRRDQAGSSNPCDAILRNVPTPSNT